MLLSDEPMKTAFQNFYKSILLLLLGCLLNSALYADETSLYKFTPEDIQYLSQFHLESLPSLPSAYSNQVVDNIVAAEFGRKLFFDPRMSSDGKVSCATCHQPKKYFTDGLSHSQAIGTTERSAPSIVYAGYSPWLFWDGRKDSLWSQALAPIEHPLEHNYPRQQVAKLISENYLSEYKNIFGNIDEGDSSTVLVNIGKAIMAYERRLELQPSRFDRFIAALKNGQSNEQLKKILNKGEVNGLRLFVGRAACVSCHNGPLFTNFEFHNTGVPETDKNNVDLGRYSGLQKLTADEFTCLSRWSDADNSKKCEEMSYLKALGPELVGAFKTPSLRNVAKTAPYMHAGQFDSLKAVVQHYNKPSPPFFNRQQHPNRPHFDLLALNLSDHELDQLVDFLKTLTSSISPADIWWQNPNH